MCTVERISQDDRWTQRRNMKLPLVLLTFILMQGGNAAGDNCWWTGCQPNTWEIRGCNPGTEQQGIEDCEGGNKYKCCPNTDSSQTTTESTLPHTPGCWWTGCQPDDWAVRGCNSEGMEERMTMDCENGNRYQCCPITKKTTSSSISDIDPDTGLSYLNLAKYLLAKNPTFNLGERLSCTLLDPDRKYLVRFGSYAVPACDMCPSFNQLLYENRLLHESPIRVLSDINFPECFGTCSENQSECVAFSHDSIARTCYQFNETVDARMSAESGFRTVIMTQPTGTVGEWNYIRNVKLTAPISNQVSSESFQDCMSNCDEDSNCRAVSYHFDSRACVMCSDLKNIESSLASSYASAFKQSSFKKGSAGDNFKLMNDDLLSASITEYKTPDAGCAKYSNNSIGAYYKPQCLFNPIKDCIVGQRCKFCYYPERSDSKKDLDICPDSIIPKAKNVLSQIEKHLAKCLELEDCIAVTFGTTYFNPIFITDSNVEKVSDSSIVYLLKNFHGHYNLILSSKLEKSSVQAGSADFVQITITSLSDCVARCNSESSCNRFSYVKRTQTCSLSSPDGMINHTDDGSEQVVGIKEIPISFTGNRYTEIPGYTAHPEVDGMYFLGNQDCSSNCHQSCQDACSSTHNCSIVIMSQNGDRMICRLYSSKDLVMEPEDFSRIMYRVNTVNINREFLDALPLFQSSDVFDCFETSNQQSQTSLDLVLPMDDSTVEIQRRRKRGIFSAIGNFFKSAAETVVETVKGVAEDIGHTVEAAGKLITGDTKGASEAIQQVGIVQDGISAVKSVGSLIKGDLEGAKEHFRDISYVQAAEGVVDTGKALIEGDWDKLGESGGEAAVGVAASFIPVIGRGKKGKRGGKKKKKVDEEVNKENHSNNKDKRSTDHEERHRENEQQGKTKKCKIRKRSRRAAGTKRPRPSKSDCDDDDDDSDDDDDNTKFCPKLTFKNLLKKSRTNTAQCKRRRVGQHCDFECDPGYDEKPDHRVKCDKSGGTLRWNQQGNRCEAESCSVRGVHNLIVISTPKPGAPNGKKMTAYVILFNKSRKIPTWSVALHDSSEFGLTDLTGLTASESAGRHASFLKHPCPELVSNQANDQSYARSGWEKGHLTPARVIRWSLKASRSVNLYVNVAPQDSVTNQQIWERIEDNAFCTGKKLRSIVATGTCSASIGSIKNGVDIPACFWKMICYVRDGQHHVVGFVIQNTKLSSSDKASIDSRREDSFIPRSQSYVIAHAAISPTKNPFLLSAPDVLRNREVFSLGPGIEGIVSVQPLLCAAALSLTADEEKQWKDGMKAQSDALAISSSSSKKKQKSKRRKTKRALIGSGSACCSPDEMSNFLASLTSTDDEDDEDDSDDEDDDEEIESTESLVSSASCGKRIVGYFTSWGKYKFSPRMAHRLTHVIFAFLETRSNGEVKVGCVDPEHSEDCTKDEELAHKRLKQLFSVTEHFDHLNVMFAVGGWENSQYFSAIAADRERRIVFIASLIQVIKDYGFDGVDVDWEYPVTGGAHEGVTEDKSNYVTLLSELRTALNNLAKLQGRDRPYLMSIAGAAGQWTLDPGYDMKGLIEQLDFINVMTYDYFGAWGSKWGAFTGPPAPLYFGMPKGFSGKTNVAWTVKYYACRSKQPHKINMGVPFYGRYWENVADVIDPSNPMWRKAEAVSGEFKGGAYTWRQLQFNISQGTFGNIEFNERTKSKYAYNSASRLYLGLEDPETLRYKVDFAVENNLGGLMIWALDQDDDGLTMLETVYDANLCANTNPSDIRFKCLPTDEQLWWTPENSDEDLQGRCGEFAPLIGGRYAACDPDDPGYSCCSEAGYCGSGPDFCDCPGCVDHGKNPDKLFDHARIPTADELRFRDSCKPNWENGCEKDDDCCSRNCFKGEKDDWKAGLCKAGKKTT
ncbi:uncharacterized protein LOC119067666 isoform X2 [Bradysia coprophila]|uniref:uncharacterized protein LOC119067666 isoform X2 n=1 Tax=Bradysia coprophila TaxID=38358 RepID=UPI00187DC77E|nr:uncharacterized protein LOC119067666 isoform X2 [Bradysia coprophila]